MNYKNRLNTSLVLDIGILLAIVIFKLIYYIGKYQRGFFGSALFFLAWTVIGILISIVPAVLILALIVSIQQRNGAAPNKYLNLKNCIGWIVFNIVFEFTSLIGATMSLDGDWMDIGIKMLFCHFLSFLPVILLRKVFKR